MSRHSLNYLYHSYTNSVLIYCDCLLYLLAHNIDLKIVDHMVCDSLLLKAVDVAAIKEIIGQID